MDDSLFRGRRVRRIVAAVACASVAAGCAGAGAGAGGRDRSRARAVPGTPAASGIAGLVWFPGWTCPEGELAGSFTAPGAPECVALRIADDDGGGGGAVEDGGGGGAVEDGAGGGSDAIEEAGGAADDTGDAAGERDAADDTGDEADAAGDEAEEADETGDPGLPADDERTHTAYLDIRGPGGVESLPFDTWTTDAERTGSVWLSGVMPLAYTGSHGVVAVHTAGDELGSRDELVVYAVRDGQVQALGSIDGPVVLVDRIDMAGVHARVVDGGVADGEPVAGARVEPVVLRYVDGAITVDAGER